MLLGGAARLFEQRRAVRAERGGHDHRDFGQIRMKVDLADQPQLDDAHAQLRIDYVAQRVAQADFLFAVRDSGFGCHLFGDVGHVVSLRIPIEGAGFDVEGAHVVAVQNPGLALDLGAERGVDQLQVDRADAGMPGDDVLVRAAALRELKILTDPLNPGEETFFAENPDERIDLLLERSISQLGAALRSDVLDHVVEDGLDLLRRQLRLQRVEQAIGEPMRRLREKLKGRASQGVYVLRAAYSLPERLRDNQALALEPAQVIVCVDRRRAQGNRDIGSGRLAALAQQVENSASVVLHAS